MGIKKEARRKYDRPPRLSFTLWNTHTGLAPHDFCGLELRHHQYVFLFKYIVFLSFVYRLRLQIYGESFNPQTKSQFFCLLGQNSAFEYPRMAGGVSHLCFIPHGKQNGRYGHVDEASFAPSEIVSLQVGAVHFFFSCNFYSLRCGIISYSSCNTSKRNDSFTVALAPWDTKR